MSFLDLIKRFGGGYSSATPLFLYNTLTKSKQPFTLPPHVEAVRMYNCGPTLYGPQHIGNLSMFVFTDILRRTLEYNDFPVKQVINFTDVGHLVSDADAGEDKMTKGLVREGLPLTLENMRALAERYGALFLENLRALNIETTDVQFPRASDYIDADVAMIQTLEEKGYAYLTKSGVYYDTSRFHDYGRLGNIALEGQREGARVASESEKRNPADFNLWKLDEKLGWDSPWGKGFPGWHIECSAMINATLGKQIDIHTGGIEHIPVHHNNEIAQSEAALGKKPLARFWMHRAHLKIEGEKIAKSEGNTTYLSDIVERSFHPLALRYLFLNAHYRTSSNFTWEALAAANVSLTRLSAFTSAPSGGIPPQKYRLHFLKKINDDLDTPGALAVLWDMTKDAAVPPADVRAGLIDADRVLGLDLQHIPQNREKSVAREELPEELQILLEDRENARNAKDFEKADRLRDQLAKEGFGVEDTAGGPRLSKL